MHNERNNPMDANRKNKHFTLAERAFIEAALREGKSIREIAKALSRDRTTVSREIRKYSVVSRKGTHYSPNQCVKRTECRLWGLCGNRPGCRRECARCRDMLCNEFCPGFERVECAKRLARPGMVCNGCPDEGRCRLLKNFYVAETAEKQYRKTLSETRAGAEAGEAELAYIDSLVSPGILNGQSVHHIFVANRDRMTRDERTVARYLHDGLLTAKRGNMKRACMVKPGRKRSREREYKVEKGCRTGRTYKDFLAFREANPDTHVVMMDLVIGRPGGKCLLTLHFPEASFMVAYLIPNKCAASVCAVFEKLRKDLGPDLFAKLFPVILTDNGTEFSNPSAIEKAPGGAPGTRVFFCDPMNSNQKSQLERNHEIVREILPKGTSFDNLSQALVSLAMSHVNAYVRYVQSDKTPYEVFTMHYGTDAAAKLGIAYVDPRRVCLKPALLGVRQPMLWETVTIAKK